MELTNREIWALNILLKSDISRYLMANSAQRLNGTEKAKYHIKITETLHNFLSAGRSNCVESLMEIHDYLADILTSRMDEVIEFPIDKPLYGEDYDPLIDKFFNVIIDHIDEIERLSNKNIIENERS